MQNLLPIQALLLQAAFADEQRAEQAWRSWQDSVRMDDIDGASQRALPHLHINNATIAASDLRVQGLYRRAWYANSLLLEKVRPLLDRLAAQRVRVVAGKQTAAVLKVRACYPLERFHLVVAETDVADTAKAMRDAGWSSPHPPKLAWTVAHGIDFRQDKFFVQLCCEPLQDAGFWGRVERLECDKGSFEVPGVADQIVEAAAPRFSWHETSMYQRVFETLIAIRYASQPPDWPAIAAIATALDVSLPLADTLDCVGNSVGADVPAGFVASLRAAPAAAREAGSYMRKRDTASLWGRLQKMQREYRSLRTLSLAHQEGFAPLDYLKLHWNVTDARGLLRRATSIATRAPTDV